jgi:hypothetical protein
VTDELSEWERGFLAGVAFRETFGFSGPTSVREIAGRAYRDPDALVADVEIPGGLRFTTDDIVPAEGPGVADEPTTTDTGESGETDTDDGGDADAGEGDETDTEESGEVESGVNGAEESSTEDGDDGRADRG